MIHILIGHRGTGKSTFLNQLRARTKRPCFDLDEEIEKQHNQSIRKLFEAGETQFRILERQALWNLVESAGDNIVIAVGAGFEGPVPSEAKVIWLRRESDESGRVFLNRPRLNDHVTMYDEYMERLKIRNKRFREWAHEELFIPEGAADLTAFVETPEDFRIPYELTLLPENFRDWFYFLERRRHWNVRHFELRDDLLNPDQMEIAAETLPAEQIIFSRRVKGEGPQLPYKTDWALELGRPKVEPYILSLHEREADFVSTLKKISAERAQILKLAVNVETFEELMAGHRWWLEDPKRRAFLPRSRDGRWRWYRSLFGPSMPVHFISEGEGSALDQPKLWQCVLQTTFKNKFAAILGHPVKQSLTPHEQHGFFAEMNRPVVPVDIRENEFDQAIPILRELGLTHAAVTAPLKLKAFAISEVKTAEASEMSAINTLHFSDKIRGHNTDVLALLQIRDELPHFNSIWCWGGGGTLTSVKKAWPAVKLMSAREGKARDGSTENAPPELLIWAAGRSQQFWFPDVHPQLVLDLNYTADSPGLEFAATRNLPYQSGLRMFKLQAGFQREFWKGLK